VGLFEKAVEAWKKADRHEQHIASQQRLREALQRYQMRYWQIALILWEVICANQMALKVIPQKFPKQLATQNYNNPKSFNRFDFKLKRTPGNTPCSDTAVLTREVEKFICNELLSLNFTGVNVKCEEDTYYYYLTITGNNLMIGRPMSPRIGRLFINRFYDADYDLFYLAYDVQYSTSTYGGIKDGATITLYSEGELIQSRTMRDPMGNIFLSRTPVCSCGNSYWAVI
jgi:hypothetical protein